jgi:hypothetical protein
MTMAAVHTRLLLALLGGSLAAVSAMAVTAMTSNVGSHDHI